jgi:hypothetical protein
MRRNIKCPGPCIGGSMNEAEHNEHRHAARREKDHRGKDAYWKRAHHDWRFWLVVILMLGAMIFYLGSFDLAWRPRVQAPAADQGGR